MHSTKIATFDRSAKLILNFSTNRLDLEENKDILTLSTSAGDTKLTENSFGLEIRENFFPVMWKTIEKAGFNYLFRVLTVWCLRMGKGDK